MPTPTIQWAVDADGDWDTAAGWSPARVPTSTDDAAINTADFHTITHSAGADRVNSLTVGNDDFVMAGGALTIASTASFASLLSVSGGTLTFSQTSDEVTITSLDWSGGTIVAGGWLDVSGPAVLTKHVSMGSDGDFRLEGSTNVVAGAVVTLGPSNEMFITGGSSTISGSFDGEGALLFTGGTQTLNAGAAMNMSMFWEITGPAVTTLGEDFTYGGVFALSDGGTLDLGGHTFELSRATNSFDGANVEGVGVLVTRGETYVDNGQVGGGLVLGRGVTWTNFGMVVQQGITDHDIRGGAIVNESAGKFYISSDTKISGRTFVNDGLLERDGTGTSRINSHVTNAGTISVTGGKLTLKYVAGDGVVTVVGGTLVIEDPAFAENVSFTGTRGALALARSQTYTGTVAGFSITRGTRLDLRDIGFVGAGEATFSGDSTGGVLTITDGAHTARINLTGDYLGARFVASDDGRGGTKVVARQRGPALAPPHALVSAIASMAHSHPALSHVEDAAAARVHWLGRPHAMTA